MQQLGLWVFGVSVLCPTTVFGEMFGWGKIPQNLLNGLSSALISATRT